MTPDRLFYPLAALVAGALIALAMVYPQGQGARSPGRFGHAPELQTAQALELARENARIDADAHRASAAAKTQKAHESDSALVRTTPLK